MKKPLSLILALIMVLSLCAPALAVELTAGEMARGAASGYSDLPADHWAAGSVNRWTDEKIIEGDGAGKVNPDGALRRGELAKVIAELLGLTEKAPAATFTDVPADKWYTDYILKCAAAGIMLGDGAGHAMPEEEISREQAIVMIGRALGLKEDKSSTGLDTFPDKSDVAPWAVGYLAPLTKMGVINGVPTADGSAAAPQRSIDRASTFTVLDRAIESYVTTPGAVTATDPNKFVVVKVADTEGSVTVSGTTAGLTVGAGTAAGVTAADLTADTVKVDAAVAVAVSGTSKVGEVAVNAEAEVTVASGVQVSTVAVNAEAEIAVASGATVDTVEANAAASIDNQGTVKTLVANADGVTADGKFESVTVAEEVTEKPADSTGKEVTDAPAPAAPTYTPPTPSISVSKSSVTVEAGENDTFTVTKSNTSAEVTAKSGNEEIATVAVENNTVTVTGVAKGTTTVTVTVGSLTRTVNVTVTKHYRVSPDVLEHGSLTFSTMSAQAGDEVTVIAYPDAGYILAGISVNGGTSIAAVNNEATFVMPDADAVVTTTFVQPVTGLTVSIIKDQSSYERFFTGTSYDKAWGVDTDKTEEADIAEAYGMPWLGVKYTTNVDGQSTVSVTKDGTLVQWGNEPNENYITASATQGNHWFVVHLTDQENTVHGQANKTYAKQDNAYGDYTVTVAACGVEAKSDPCLYDEPGVTYHTVSFETDGGSAVAAQHIKDGGVAREPDAPTKTGYKFKGWKLNAEPEPGTNYDFETAVTGDITLNAIWEANKYTVTLPTGLTGGTVTSEDVPDDNQVAYGTTVTLTVTPDTGYELDALTWNGTDITEDKFDMPAGDVIVEATFKKLEYQVSFDGLTNATPATIEAQTVKHGENPTAVTAPTKTGYTFTGWKAGEAAPVMDVSTVAITAATTFIAQWEAIQVSEITVTAADGKTALNVGETVVLTATVTPEDALNKSVNWRSSNEDVATVNAGTVTAVAEGNATITATAADGSNVSGTISITVAAPETPDTPTTYTVTAAEGKAIVLFFPGTSSYDGAFEANASVTARVTPTSSIYGVGNLLSEVKVYKTDDERKSEIEHSFSYSDGWTLTFTMPDGNVTVEPVVTETNAEQLTPSQAYSDYTVAGVTLGFKAGELDVAVNEATMQDAWSKEETKGQMTTSGAAVMKHGDYLYISAKMFQVPSGESVTVYSSVNGAQFRDITAELDKLGGYYVDWFGVAHIYGDNLEMLSSGPMDITYKVVNGETTNYYYVMVDRKITPAPAD